MALIKRKVKKEVARDGEVTVVKKKVKILKRPAYIAFKQQKIRTWQPILIPKAVLPTILLIGLIFAPIGALIVWGSSRVTAITLDYTECDVEAPTSGEFGMMPNNKYSYDLATGSRPLPSLSSPTWSFSNDSRRPVGERMQCEIIFTLPNDIGPGVFLYYKLTNYYQNHRRYVQSFDADQLLGDAKTASSVDVGDCIPITSLEGRPYYPCGLIANSFFNDTFPRVTMLDPSNDRNNRVYAFSEKNIAWHGLARQYVTSPSYPVPSDVLPPPNWAEKYPEGYTDETGFPNLAEDEHFHVWMRVAPLSTFRKLWGRNDNETMSAGTYRILINMNYPVKSFHSTKSVVISTVSWIGGKQPFLGWAYVAASILCVTLAIAGSVLHLVMPRKLGEINSLSWKHL